MHKYVINKMENIRRSISILIVEDDDLLQKITPLILKLSGYSTTLVTTGKEAINLFTQQFDLILLDIRLPDMSGFEVCKEMRAIETRNGTHTPILAYTAFGELVKKKCLEAGMDDLLTKGCSITEINQVIHKMVTRFSSNAQSASHKLK